MSDIASDLAALLGSDPSTKSLTDIRAIVRSRGNLRNAIRFPNSVIDVEIQAAFGEAYELIADTNEGYFDVSDTVFTTASVDFVAPPTGTWRIRAVDRLDGVDYIEVPRVGIKDRNRFSATPGKPEGHRLSARGIELRPTPDAVYTIRVIYTPVAPTLDGTQRAFFNGWDEYAVFGALLRIYQQQNRDASEWQKQIDRQRERLGRAPTHRNASGPEYLNLYESEGDGDLDRPVTWSW